MVIKIIYWDWATRISLSSQAIVHLAPFCFHVILATAGEGGKELFLQEIEFMKQIGSHRNVLSMIGYWVKSEPIMLILEYVPHGDLLQWLRGKMQQVKKMLVVQERDWKRYSFSKLNKPKSDVHDYFKQMLRIKYQSTINLT